MFTACSKRIRVFALVAVLLAALIVVAVAGCGGSFNAPTTAASTTASSAAIAPTSASSTSSSLAGAQTTATTAAAQGQTGSGAQALTDLLDKYKKVQSVSLDFKLTTAGGTGTSGAMWSEAGKMLKIDITISGLEQVMLINLTDNTMTSWQPATKQGTKIKSPAAFSDPSSYLNGVDISKVQDLGTADINGETCHVVQFTTTIDGASTASKMWLSERLGFPVRVETSTASGDSAMTMDYTNVKVGSLPSDTFIVPADVKIATP